MGLGKTVEADRKVGQIADFVDTSRRLRFGGGMEGIAGFAGGNRLGRDEAVAGAAVGLVAGVGGTAVVPEERMAQSLSVFSAGCRWIGLPLRGCTDAGRELTRNNEQHSSVWRNGFGFRTSCGETRCGLGFPKEQQEPHSSTTLIIQV